MKQTYDVIVVGAGPAGAILAYELAKKGIKVSLLEKEKLPRYKCCAGGVTARAAKLLDFAISEVAEDVVYAVSITYNSGIPYLGHYSQPLVYTVMRDAFDYFLVKRARQSGAIVIDGQEATQIQTDADWIEISTTDSIFRSRVVAGTDGAYSIVARRLGIRKNIEYIAGIETELVVPQEELVKRKSRVEIDIGFIPGGYAWAFPKRDHLSVGAGCLASRAGGLNHCYENFLNSLGISNYTIARTNSHLIPTCGGKGIVSQGKALLLGDAAGLADPFTGEGIYNAIQSAQLAAPVIEKSLAQSKIDLQDYQQAIEEKIMPEIRIAHVLSRIFSHFPYLAFRMLVANEKLQRGLGYLLRGEINYATMKERLGGFKGIFALLSRM